MYLTAALFLSGIALAVPEPSVSGQMNGGRLLADSLFSRQTRICSPVAPGPNLCARSCGDGYITCISLPTCYNPDIGQTCCSDGTYCPDGYYCTDNGCCPNGKSLSECNASSTLATVAPTPGSTQTASSSTINGGTTTSTAQVTIATLTSQLTATVTAIGTGGPSVPAGNATMTYSSPTASLPAQQTTNAATRNVAGLALGGIGFLLMWI